MKRLFGLILAFGLLVQAPVYSADQWDTTDPAGSSLAADIDTNIIANNESLDRLIIRYKRGLGVNYSTAATLSVLAGELAIPDSSDGTVRLRRTTTATSITWADIDTGAEASGTQYYLYATADTDITGMVFKISASSSAPSGSTYYRKIAEFYNDSSSNITNVKSIRDDDGTDYPDDIKGWVNFTGTGTVTINDSYNVSSITDNGTGDYTVNWTTAFASANYSLVVTPIANASAASRSASLYSTTPLTTTSARIQILDNDGNTVSSVDPSLICVIATGDRT